MADETDAVSATPEVAKSLGAAAESIEPEIQDLHECTPSNAAHELNLSQSPNLHENPTPHPLPEFELVVPSPDLHKLPFSKPLDEIVLTPIPNLHGPFAPESRVETEFTPSSHLHELSSSKPPEDIKLIPNTDLYERPFPKLQDEIELAPILETNDETPEPTKMTLPTILTENTRNLADENDANTSKPEGVHSSEMNEIELDAVDQEILKCETPEPSQNKVTTSPEPSDGTPEPVGVKWKLPARSMLHTTENIQKKIVAFQKNLVESSNMEPSLDLTDETSENIRPPKRSRPKRMTLLPTQTKRSPEPVNEPKRVMHPEMTLHPSDNESEVVDYEISDCPSPELIDEIERTSSPELTEGSLEPLPPKRSRPTVIKLLPRLLTEINHLVTVDKNYAGSFEQKSTKSNKMETSESEEAEKEMIERPTTELTDEIERTSSAELTNGSSDAARASKRGALNKIKLLPQLLTEIKQLIDASSSKKKMCVTYDMRDIDSEEDAHEVSEHYTPEPIDDLELSNSPELTEGSCEASVASTEPITPEIKKKLTRSKLVSTAKPKKMTQLSTARVSPAQLRRNIYSPSASGTSSGAQAHGAHTLAGSLTARARPSIRSHASLEFQRTVPRRIASETGLPARRILRTPERKGTNILTCKISQKRSKRRVRMRAARHRQTGSESDSNAPDSSPSGNDSSNDGIGSGYSDGSGGSGGNRGQEGHRDGGDASHVRNPNIDILNTAEEVPAKELNKFYRRCVLM